MRNIKLVLEYDGTNYYGWQTQPNLPTVQGTIEDALEKLTKTPIQIIGAGRTDSGVHAAGQVANFRTPSQIPLIAFQKGLNATLPRDIVVCSATEVSADFHARFSATSRRYRYTLLNREYPSALSRQTSYFLSEALNVERINDLSQLLIGKKDFSSFQKTGSDRINPVCKIYEARWWQKEPYVYFEIEADSFLRGMVRGIVGTVLTFNRKFLLASGAKNMKYEDAKTELLRILEAKDRSAAGMSVPAHGLSLINVKYNALPLLR
ncbi:tRNA pseudouridine(38-40) synthase TruA [Candidatus Poribacteria bacterium]|nr:tRNA pseudouridine(38-40) synthase TruA [Candidatus Poribacteria bacterium]MYK92602.1 tRNA pseudouridine(38-40) synthase TruA [Candidatus Poribacteria bacterium]